MVMSKISITFTVDTTTGLIEIINQETLQKVSTSTKSNNVTEESQIPQLILSENKFTLNNKAIEVINAKIGDKISVNYESDGYPILGINYLGGNKLTKSNTVSCRGVANEELSKQGNIFEIIPHPEKEGFFRLIGENPPAPVVQDENIQIPEEVFVKEPPETTEEDPSIDDLLAELELEDKPMTALDFTLD